jgi:hypothetical protein
MLAKIFTGNYTAPPAYSASWLSFFVLKLHCAVLVRELLHNQFSTAGVIQC